MKKEMLLKLKTKRIEKGISSSEMARILKMSKSSYSKKENGKIRFSLEEAELISQFFKEQIEDLFFLPKL